MGPSAGNEQAHGKGGLWGAGTGLRPVPAPHNPPILPSWHLRLGIEPQPVLDDRPVAPTQRIQSL